MTAITLEAIEARHKEVAKMIEQFRSQAAARLLVLPEVGIDLQPGEHYAGAVLSEDGTVKHHLVLMAQRSDGRLGWQEAMDWATGVGGSLPDRQEQALLFTNCKAHLEAAWHWSSQTYESDASSAWGCFFNHGDQYGYRKSYEGAAVAVRRIS